MPEDKVQLLQRHYEALAEGDIDTVLACYALDTVWDDRDRRPEGAIHRGHEAMNAEIGRWFASWEDYRWDVEAMLEVGDQVLVVGRERGTGKASGLEVDHRVGLVITFRDGLIVETQVFKDPGSGQSHHRAVSDAGEPAFHGQARLAPRFGLNASAYPTGDVRGQRFGQ